MSEASVGGGPRHPEFVEWLDSAGPHGWVCFGPDTAKPAMICWSVGYVIHETPAEIVVAGSLGFDGRALSCAHSPITIPLAAVRRRIPLPKAPAISAESTVDRIVVAEEAGP